MIPRTAAGIALLLVLVVRAFLERLSLIWASLLPTDWLGSLSRCFLSVCHCWSTHPDKLFRQLIVIWNKPPRSMARLPGRFFWQISLPLAWRGVLNGAIMMFARGISEFGAVIILAYSPKIVPVLIYERFQGYGLEAATQ